MALVQDFSAEQFLIHAGPMLYASEAAHSLILGLCEGLVSSDDTPPLLIRDTVEGKTLSAALQSAPGMNLLITKSSSPFLKDLSKHLKNMGASFPGIVGPPQECKELAHEWTTLTGLTAQLGMAQKIFELKRVRFPSGSSGSLHPCEAKDIEKVFEWSLAFVKESLPESDTRSEDHWRHRAEKVIGEGRAYFWKVKGAPVSMATSDRPTKNGITINGVYTPPEHRKRGYASALVAHLSQMMLDSGRKFCVLYTDLSNPTSNKIYQNVGYEEVCGSSYYFFTS